MFDALFLIAALYTSFCCDHEQVFHQAMRLRQDRVATLILLHAANQGEDLGAANAQIFAYAVWAGLPSVVDFLCGHRLSSMVDSLLCTHNGALFASSGVNGHQQITREGMLHALLLQARDIATCRVLLEHGAPINVKSDVGDIARGKISDYCMLRDRGQTSQEDYDRLHRVIYFLRVHGALGDRFTGETWVMRSVLDSNFEIADCSQGQLNSALRIAIAQGKTDLVGRLLETSACVLANCPYAARGYETTMDLMHQLITASELYRLEEHEKMYSIVAKLLYKKAGGELRRHAYWGRAEDQALPDELLWLIMLKVFSEKYSWLRNAPPELVEAFREAFENIH